MSSKFGATLFLAAIFMACFLLNQVSSASVTLFDNVNHQGDTWEARDFGGCRNVDGWMNDRASSVSTHGGCVILCEHGDCQGECIRVEPGRGNHGWLGEMNFNDKTSSVKEC